MDLSPTDITSVSIGPCKADEEHYSKLTDILRQRRRPLLLVIGEKYELIYPSLPDDTPDKQLNACTITPGLMKPLLVAAKRRFHSEAHSVATDLRQLLLDKPGILLRMSKH